jgi:hypothetical protein
MPKKPIEILETNDGKTDSESEESEYEPQKLEKCKDDPKPKKEHVMTEARKLAFEKARQKKQENFLLRKAIKDKEKGEYNAIKNEKALKRQEKEAKRREYELQKLDMSSSEDEPIIVKKKKSRRKVIYVSDDEDDGKNIIIVNRLDPKPPAPVAPVAISKPRKAIFL